MSDDSVSMIDGAASPHTTVGAGEAHSLSTRSMPTRRRFLATLGATAATLALAACTAGPLPQPKEPIRFTDRAPYRLAVASVEVVDDYQPPLSPPNVDHEFPTPPREAIRAWAGDRLRAAAGGGLRLARLSIIDASVVEKPLSRTGGVRGILTNEPSENLVGNVSVLLEILDADGARLGYTKVAAQRTRGIMEDASLREREDIYDEMARGMMSDLDKQLSANIERHLGRFIRP